MAILDKIGVEIDIGDIICLNNSKDDTINICRVYEIGNGSMTYRVVLKKYLNIVDIKKLIKGELKLNRSQEKEKLLFSYKKNNNILVIKKHKNINK